MKISYCNDWQTSIGAPFIEWSEQKAKHAHSTGQPYCALLYENGQYPSFTVKVKNGQNISVDVRCLDSEGHLTSAFYYIDEGRIDEVFLHTAVGFGGGRKKTDLNSHIWRLTHSFTTAGDATTTYFKDRMYPNNLKCKWQADVSAHWKSLPSFGDYSHFCSYDLGQSWDVFDDHGLKANEMDP